MQTRRNKTRRLSVQNLEARKLFAADVGFGDMTYGPEAPAEIGSVRPGKVGRPTFGPLNNGCPPCDIENQAERFATNTQMISIIWHLYHACKSISVFNEKQTSLT